MGKPSWQQSLNGHWKLCWWASVGFHGPLEPWPANDDVFCYYNRGKETKAKTIEEGYNGSCPHINWFSIRVGHGWYLALYLISTLLYAGGELINWLHVTVLASLVAPDLAVVSTDPQIFRVAFCTTPALKSVYQRWPLCYCVAVQYFPALI